jgi:hypothetical protein
MHQSHPENIIPHHLTHLSSSDGTKTDLTLFFPLLFDSKKGEAESDDIDQIDQ